MPIRLFYIALVAIMLLSCKHETKTLFTRLSEDETGINFRNLLKEDDDQFNIIFYPYFYNGGGVAVGDVNNDGLQDVFFTGNMVKNRLFINEGDFEFQDVTVRSGVAEKEGWCTGATMVDINEDGWLDIYVCRSGLSNINYRKNLLFINNHDLTFTEQAAQYGLDDPGYSTQASFFDYDKDGDLDMFLINQSTPEYSQGKIEYLQMHNQRSDSTLENKLYRNDNKHFTNVTSTSGIQSNVLTFSLGLSTADLDQDGWPDIYVANDFKEPDYLYINNHDGTFTESLAKKIDHTSLYAMGMDVADYNNDLLPDMIILDMLAESNRAQKMHMGGDNFNQYNFLFRNGMFHQYMKNSLQKNNGDGTFSEIAQLAGVSNTDWSWSPLLADYDNDGLKDLFITNGYKRDNTDIEFIIYSMNESIRIQKGGDAVNAAEYISHMPGIHIPNYIYKNVGNDKFENKIKEWGFDHNTFSHGAVYADLDNDGDLDLITNNTDEYAGVYRNNGETLLNNNNFLKIKLRGRKSNPTGIGAKVYAYAGDKTFYLEQNPVRGYQSSVDENLHLGLGSISILDSLRVIWPDGTGRVVKDVRAKQTLTINIEGAGIYSNHPTDAPLLVEAGNAIEFVHRENQENDFTRQFLLPYFYSHNGPCMAKGDVNGDNLEDIFVGGAKSQSGAIFAQLPDGTFKVLDTAELNSDAASEDTDAMFFDADGDRDLDLYVVSGGYEFEEHSSLLQDRLYLNNGRGTFSKSSNLPQHFANKSCIAAADVDGDGDTDLFVGGKVKPGRFPLAEPSKIFINNGKGKFTDATVQLASTLENLGMVNDGVWTDVNRDGKADLVVVGEWMTPKVFINEGDLFTDQTEKHFPANLKGWWNTILAHDFDRDGDEDLVIGNYGLNSQLNVSEQRPVELYHSDVDGNGSIDPIMMHYVGSQSHPLVPRDDLNSQIPGMKKKFNDYRTYADATIHNILSAEQLSKATLNSAATLETVFLENNNSSFKKLFLPVEAQYAPVFAIAAMDINSDGNDDIILAGNNKYNRVYLGKHDANHGVVLLGSGMNSFRYLPQGQSGLNLRGDVRSILAMPNGLFFGVSDSPIRVYRRR